MLIDLLMENLWVSFGLWAGLFLLNNGLVSVTLRLYQRGANKHFSYEVSPVLGPKFQKSVTGRWMDWRTLRILLFGFLAFALVWWNGRKIARPEFFEGLLGAMWLICLAVLVRHSRSLLLYSYVSRSLGVSGKVEMAHWLTLRTSAAEFLGWALFFGVLFILLGRWFFFGGSIACLISAVKQFGWSRQARRKAESV